MASEKQKRRGTDTLGVKGSINASPGEEVKITEKNKQNKARRQESYADDMRILSAFSFVLGGTFFGMFNSFMNHNIPSLPPCKGQKPASTSLITLYVVLATIGFMFLFSSALISYELFLLFRDKKITDPTQQWKYLKFCYLFTFFAIVICFAAHSISLYIVQCKKDTILLAYVPTLGSICLIAVIVIGVLNYKFHKRNT
ncbi:uncharacterized protein LOC110238418 [Exaiptasia diaphana]|uniref:Uncharacterized protein n=1 Tax=Exaiptasia diaphana TaxID=2652724 RepID=A0A913X6Q6_EXADI|nr:uncharacterized protein LOC110238418 [Exaiptasia diaphana]KXJ14776.1 hypothetical protein AC249_AIPGENE29274 [Exaiptasia diaphana]